MATLEEFIASQEDLVKEASLALPHQFSQCTYTLGHIRQAVYLCLTCPESRGICSACSVACHTNHEQIELFPKRHFRCDCPTAAISHACTLHTKPEEENAANLYGQNFKGVFCRCGRPYDAKTERETMIQCLMCEDWFHESCCNLRERPSSREPTPTTPAVGSELASDDHLSESSSDLPPALLTASKYDNFICGACAAKSELLKRWAGTPGITMVVRETPESQWKCLKNEQVDVLEVDVSETTDDPQIGAKRSLSSDARNPLPKKARVSPESTSPSSLAVCSAPPENSIAKRIYADLSAVQSSELLGTGDLFLTEGFRDRWCHCKSCSSILNAHPYLLEEEETYEPPEDPDSGLSLEELGLRALSRIPRDRAIDGIHAFNSMRNELVDYLRPFAQQGKVVSESDVRLFFASLTEARNKPTP
ncbi:hypothetical protein AX17_004807 [Amanita inopinata Kibby_2008]|nr:hypothetical protein AX17_004807 [Amanita inopinata Kibby_2008]